MKNWKIQELDILRALAALAVITIHTNQFFSFIPQQNSLKYSLLFIQNLSSFAVPCFTFISGLVLYNNYQVISESIGKFYYKRFARILPVYTLFFILYFVYSAIKEYKLTHSFHIVPLDIISKFLLGGAFYHLWYWGLLFQLYLLYPLFSYLYRKNHWVFLTSLLVIQMIWGYIKPNFPDEVSTYLPILGYCFYFTLGFYFVEHKTKIITSKLFNPYLLFTVIMGLCIIRNQATFRGLNDGFQFAEIPLNYYYSVLATQPIFYFFLIIFFYKASLWILERNNWLTISLVSFGQHSLLIYLIHALIISILNILLLSRNIGHETAAFYFIIWTITVVFSYIFAVIYSKIKSAFKKLKPELAS